MQHCVVQRVLPKHENSLPELELLLGIFQNEGVFQLETSVVVIMLVHFVRVYIKESGRK